MYFNHVSAFTANCLVTLYKYVFVYMIAAIIGFFIHKNTFFFIVFINFVYQHFIIKTRDCLYSLISSTHIRFRQSHPQLSNADDQTRDRFGFLPLFDISIAPLNSLL